LLDSLVIPSQIIFFILSDIVHKQTIKCRFIKVDMTNDVWLLTTLSRGHFIWWNV